MTDSLPSFRKPPVVETALSVQFRPLKAFGNVHLGLFWREMRDQFPQSQDAEPIEPQIEQFGSALPKARFPQLRVAAASPAARVRMVSADRHMMVQIQNGRLVYNWRRLEDGEYPRWKSVVPGFQTAMKRFGKFLASQHLGEIEPNQWEVTYVNHLIRGRDWNEHAEWPDLLPGLIGSVRSVSIGAFESCGCHSQFILPGDAGRLHVVLSHGFTGTEDDASELLALQFTARGGIEPDNGHGWEAGLALGHAAIVRAFAELTGERAHRIWERES